MLLALAASHAPLRIPGTASNPAMAGELRRPENAVTVFLCGDVMLGRGIDQVLPYPSNPQLHEGSITSALGYVQLAEKAHGPIP